MIIEAVCRVCGKALQLQAPLESLQPDFRRLLENISKMVVCNACYDTKGLRYRQTQEAEEIARRASAWGGICPPRYQDTDHERLLREHPYAQQVLDWQWGPKGLCVHGQPNKGEPRQGKTRSVFLLLRREHDAGKVIVAMTHQEFTESAKRVSLTPGQREIKRWFEVMRHADILFLDDFGKSVLVTSDAAGKQAEEALFAICEARWNNKLPVIFTSNDTGETIQGRMSLERGPQFVARMREFSEAIRAK